MIREITCEDLIQCYKNKYLLVIKLKLPKKEIGKFLNTPSRKGLGFLREEFEELSSKTPDKREWEIYQAACYVCKFALHFPMEVQRISYVGGSLILTMESDEDLYLEQLRDMIYNLNIHD